ESKAIEEGFKAMNAKDKQLDKQHIRYDANSGVLTLKGDVDTAAQRQKFEKMAAQVPNVTQVVNELELKNNAKGTMGKQTNGKEQASLRARFSFFKRLFVHDKRHFLDLAAVVLLQHIDQ